MEFNLLDFILADTYNQPDALKRMRLLKSSMLAKLFNSQKAVETEDVSDTDQIWLEQAETKLADTLNAKNVYKAFEDAEKEIKEILPLVVYVPFDIPDVEIKRLGAKLREDFGKNFLMDLKYDPSLIAGTAFVWKGVMHDYSVRQKIKEHRQTILQTFKEYAGH